MIDTGERRIRRYIEDKNNFSNIVYDLSFWGFTAEKLSDCISQAGIAITNKRKLKKILDDYKGYSMVKSIYVICQYIRNASIGIYGVSYDSHIEMACVSTMLRNHYFSKIIGDDVTLFLKIFMQECYAYILGLKFTDICKCPQCGKMFVKTESRQRYCSKTCSNNFRSTKYRRKLNNER